MPKVKLPRINFSWNSDLAYAVGLLATDGNLSSDGRHVILTSSDKQLLETFTACLKKENKIALNHAGNLAKKTSYHVQIGDVVFYDWLKKIGLMPKKSLVIGKLKINKKYFRDFLRGHLDGDGSIIHYKDGYHAYLNPNYIYDRLFVYFISASKKHILWLRGTIVDLRKISGSVQTDRPADTAKTNNPMHRLKFSTKEAKILLNWIYYKEGLPCLHRKFIIAKSFLNYVHRNN